MISRSTRAGGYALVETMVTIVVIAFGLLGVAGLVSRSFVTEAEATQRTQAALLLQDMVTRIEANRANAVQYVTGDAGITGYETVNSTKSLLNCDPAAPLVERDRCEWGRLIAGDAIINDNFAPTNCGRDLYGNEAQRRIVTTLLRIGTLNPPVGAGGAP